MTPDDLVVEVRDVTLRRVGAILPRDLVFKATLRDLAPAEWSATLPVEHPMAGPLRQPGAGLIVSHRDRSVPTLLSGPAVPVETTRSGEDPRGTVTVTGTDDSCLLFQRMAYPNPGNHETDQPAGWDVRSGDAETVMRDYVAANMTPAAYPARVVPGLTVDPENLQRGGQVDRSARFDYLGDLLAGISTQAGLGFRLVQEGDSLVFRVVERRDRSRTVQLDLGNGTLASMVATVSPPSLTHALVAGQGDGGARTLVLRTIDTGLPWGPWGRREAFLDQRNTNVGAELAQAGDKALVEAVGEAAVRAVPGESQMMRWPQDWDRGDLVGLVINGTQATARVSEVLLVADGDGVRVGASIGDPVGWTPNARLIARQDALEARLSALERNTGTGTVA